MVCGLLCCAAGLWVAKWFWVLFIDFGWFGMVNAFCGLTLVADLVVLLYLLLVGGLFTWFVLIWLAICLWWLRSSLCLCCLVACWWFALCLGHIVWCFIVF